MPRRPFAHAVLACATIVAVTALLTVAGPLSPPAGPVASTYKTLTDVEPRTPISLAATPGDADSLFKITQPGSYYLTGNITGVSGKSGIEIASSRVTIDLMGFTLSGVAGSLDGIVATADYFCLAIHDGIITGFGGDGIDLLTAGTTANSRIERIHARGNSLAGILAGTAAVVRECTASFNGGNGIDLDNAASVAGCTATANGGSGFKMLIGSSVTNCSAKDNALTGFVMGAGSSVTACAAYSNLGAGINAAGGCNISGNTVRFNTLDGIVVSSGGLVRDNDCTGSGLDAGSGANILATSFDNRIEGNNSSLGDRGIQAFGAGNIIIRNTSSGATGGNWVIAANNVVGPILNRTAPASAAINGDVAPSSLATTDPNANFTY